MFTTGLGAAEPGNLYEQITSTDTTLLQVKFGINSPFTFIVGQKADTQFGRTETSKRKHTRCNECDTLTTVFFFCLFFFLLAFSLLLIRFFLRFCSNSTVPACWPIAWSPHART